MTSVRSSRLGPEARPVAVPDDAAYPRSGRPKLYDLARRSDRLRVYEQVLREGNDDDVRLYIDIDELLLLWDELVLPDYVRRSWAGWFRRHGRPGPGC